MSDIDQYGYIVLDEDERREAPEQLEAVEPWRKCPRICHEWEYCTNPDDCSAQLTCIYCHEHDAAANTDACETCIAVAEAAWDARIALLKTRRPRLGLLAELREVLADIAGGV